MMGVFLGEADHFDSVVCDFWVLGGCRAWERLAGGVMAAQKILILFAEVRILPGQPESGRRS